MKMPLNVVTISMLSMLPLYHSQVNALPSLTLATNYEQSVDYTGYWASEKLDGIRAYWDGKALFTRNGHPIFAPDSFISHLPRHPVEGELWAGRGNFHLVQQTVLDKTPHLEAWSKIQFALFDIPSSYERFQRRYVALNKLVEQINSESIIVIPQTRMSSNHEITDMLQSIDEQGGEGVMLRNPNSAYIPERNTTLIKLKSYFDAEAMVIGYKAGKGTIKGKMGALIVKLKDGTQFSIGSGFTLKDREKPPKIGETINFRYNGKTQNGIPKFARYIKVRPIRY